MYDVVADLWDAFEKEVSRIYGLAPVEHKEMWSKLLRRLFTVVGTAEDTSLRATDEDEDDHDLMLNLIVNYVDTFVEMEFRRLGGSTRELWPPRLAREKCSPYEEKLLETIKTSWEEGGGFKGISLETACDKDKELEACMEVLCYSHYMSRMGNLETPRPTQKEGHKPHRFKQSLLHGLAITGPEDPVELAWQDVQLTTTDTVEWDSAVTHFGAMIAATFLSQSCAIQPCDVRLAPGTQGADTCKCMEDFVKMNTDLEISDDLDIKPGPNAITTLLAMQDGLIIESVIRHLFAIGAFGIRYLSVDLVTNTLNIRWTPGEREKVAKNLLAFCGADAAPYDKDVHGGDFSIILKEDDTVIRMSWYNYSAVMSALYQLQDASEVVRLAERAYARRTGGFMTNNVSVLMDLGHELVMVSAANKERVGFNYVLDAIMAGAVQGNVNEGYTIEYSEADVSKRQTLMGAVTSGAEQAGWNKRLVDTNGALLALTHEKTQLAVVAKGNKRQFTVPRGATYKTRLQEHLTAKGLNVLKRYTKKNLEEMDKTTKKFNKWLKENKKEEKEVKPEKKKGPVVKGKTTKVKETEKKKTKTKAKSKKGSQKDGVEKKGKRKSPSAVDNKEQGHGKKERKTRGVRGDRTTKGGKSPMQSKLALLKKGEMETNSFDNANTNGSGSPSEADSEEEDKDGDDEGDDEEEDNGVGGA
jgi:hypothetical protein